MGSESLPCEQLAGAGLRHRFSNITQKRKSTSVPTRQYQGLAYAKAQSGQRHSDGWMQPDIGNLKSR